MNKIFPLYKELLVKHGDPENLWPDWCSKNKSLRTRELIVIGAILTQRTSWRNAEISLGKLIKEHLFSLEKITKLSDLSKLTELIRSAGFYTTKPKRLYELSSYITRNGGLSTLLKRDASSLREELLHIYGIGPETADTLLLYAFDKPSFIIDEYTKRFTQKYKLGVTENSYNNLKRMFEEFLPKDTILFQNYHVLIIVDQKGKELSRMEKLTK